MKILNDKENICEFNRFFLYYAIILLFPVIVSAALYLSYTNAISNDMISAGNANVQQMQKFVDSKINDILDITDGIMFDKDIATYAAYSENDYTPFIRYEINKLYPKIEQLIRSSEYIDNIYVVFPKSHSIIADSFRYQGRSADYVSKSVFNENLNGLTRLLYSKVYSSGILKIDKENINGSMLVIARPIIDTKSSLIVALAAVTIRLDKLFDFVDSVSYNDSSSFLVTKDNLTYNYSNDLSNVSLQYTQLEDGVSFVNGGSHEYALACSQSTRSDLKYVFVTSTESFFAGVNALKRQLYYFIVLCLLFGSLFVWIAATHSYRPIKKLMRIVSSYKNGMNPFKNEYKVLEKAFSDLHSQLKKDEMLQFRHEIVIKDATIKSALQGEPYPKDYLKTFDEYFHNDAIFYVMYFIVKDKYSSISDLKEYSYDESINIHFVIIKSLSEELITEKGYHVQTVYYQNAPVSVIGSSIEQDNESEIYSSLVRIAMIVKEHFGLNIKVGISDAGTSQELPKLYSHAKDTADYIRLFDHNDVCLSWRKVGFSADDDVSFVNLVENERSMILHIKNRDIQRASEASKTLIDSIITANPPMSMHIVRIYITRVKQLVWQAVDNVSQYYEDNNFIVENRPYERMERAPDIFQLQDTICDIFFELEDYLESKINLRRSSTINDIIEYINNNYMDPGLSVTGIADMVGRTQTYISKLFKDTTGETITEYIHRVRVEHVKGLLIGQSNSRMTLQIIAEKVGFTNTWTMNRIFRKYEQITPGEYRSVYKNT